MARELVGQWGKDLDIDPWTTSRSTKKIQGGAEIGSYCEYVKHRIILALLFINYYIIFPYEQP